MRKSWQPLSIDGGTLQATIQIVLQEVLKSATLDPAKLKPISRFSIPLHEVDNGLPFTKPAKAYLNEWSRSENELWLLEYKRLERISVAIQCDAYSRQPARVCEKLF